MSKKWNRTDTRLALIAVAVGLGLTALQGLFAYMASTLLLHEGPDAVPSVAQSAPSERWTAAVQRGQQIMRADLLLSAAVEAVVACMPSGSKTCACMNARNG